MKSLLTETKQKRIYIIQIWQIKVVDLIENKFAKLFLTACQEHGLTDPKQYTFVFNCAWEGVGPVHIKLCIDGLRQHGIEIKYRVIYSTCVNVDLLDHPAMTNPLKLINLDGFIDHCISKSIDWQNLDIDNKFICLMRRPSPARINLARKLFTTFKRTPFRISLGCHTDDSVYTEEEILPGIKLPLILDHPRVRENQYLPNHDIFYRNYINLVVETSVENQRFYWSDIFLTEKTWKSFLWHQFPIWYSTAGTVNEVRKLGFDVFDDLFDEHRYDTISDPGSRADAMIKCLRLITVKNLADLRQRHWKRLKFNFDHLLELKNTKAILLQQKETEFIYGA